MGAGALILPESPRGRSAGPSGWWWAVTVGARGRFSRALFPSYALSLAPRLARSQASNSGQVARLNALSGAIQSRMTSKWLRPGTSSVVTGLPCAAQTWA